MIQYRAFLNGDPPALAQIWNEAFTGRGAVRLAHSTPFEYHVFAKPYFERAGLILAFDGSVPVGFVHAGFGPDDRQTALSTGAGVVSILGVRPKYRRQGIGTELLRRAEDYLRERGAQSFQAGPHWPLNPFYLGLYGGADSPGFLHSDAAAAPFFTARGYAAGPTTLVLQRRLDRAVSLADARFPALRKQYDVQIAPRGKADSWWRECVLGPVELLEFRLLEKGSGLRAGWMEIWEMDGFRYRWNETPIGVMRLEVVQERRRQGLAKFLLGQSLRWLQDQYFSLVEVQVAADDTACLGLTRGLGFEQVDAGVTYHKPAAVSGSPT